MGDFETYKYLGVFELDQIKEKHMKEIITSTYSKRIRTLLNSALNGQNLTLAINMWALPLICYTAGIIKWSLCELKQLDISTRKLLALYKCFSVNDDVDRLYVPRQGGGRSLFSVEDIVFHERLSLSKYLASTKEPLLECLSVHSGLFYRNLHQNLRLRGSKITMILGSQSHCMVNLLGKLMVVLIYHSNGNGCIAVI